MPALATASSLTGPQPDAVRRGAALLGQQIWCWGRDVLRDEGNWLVEVGFLRTTPPVDRKNCSSVYTLELSGGRRVVLRGFGVFYGDDRHGGVFLPRYEFRPRFTTVAALERPPWSDTDLPGFCEPTAPQQAALRALTLELLDWIRGYEQTIAERLGHDYRRQTLEKWSDRDRAVVPAEAMADAWQTLAAQLYQAPAG